MIFKINLNLLDQKLSEFTLKILSGFAHKRNNSNNSIILFYVPWKIKKRLTPNLDYAVLISEAEFDIPVKIIPLRKYIPGFIHVLVLFSKLLKQKITIVIPAYNPSKFRFPSQKILQQLGRMNVRFVIIWMDSLYSGIEEKVIKTLGYTARHIVSDDPFLNVKFKVNRTSFQPIFFPFPNFPKKRLYQLEKHSDRKIDVYFSGNIRGQKGYLLREDYLKYLEKNDILVSGVRNASFTNNNINELNPYSKYIEDLKNSKIGLNFSWHSDSTIINGRIWEIISSGALLFSNPDTKLEKFFIPFKDFVPFNSPEQLLEVLIYYLSRPEKRLEIVNSARFKTQNLFSSEIFLSVLTK